MPYCQIFITSNLFFNMRLYMCFTTHQRFGQIMKQLLYFEYAIRCQFFYQKGITISQSLKALYSVGAACSKKLQAGLIAGEVRGHF